MEAYIREMGGIYYIILGNPKYHADNVVLKDFDSLASAERYFKKYGYHSK